MSNEIKIYVQDKEGTKNEIHFIINNVICWGKRCSLNTKEQLLTAGFEIRMPEVLEEGVIIPESTELEEDKQQLEDENQTDIETNSAQLEGTGHELVLDEVELPYKEPNINEEGIEEQKEEDAAFPDSELSNEDDDAQNQLNLADEDEQIEAKKQEAYLSSQEENN